MKTNEECRTTLTNEERQKLCEWLRDRSYLPNTLCKQAADEIERLAKRLEELEQRDRNIANDIRAI